MYTVYYSVIIFTILTTVLIYRLSCSENSETDGIDVSGTGQTSTGNGLSLLNNEKIPVVRVISYSKACDFYVEYKSGNQYNDNLAYSVNHLTNRR